MSILLALHCFGNIALGEQFPESSSTFLVIGCFEMQQVKLTTQFTGAQNLSCALDMKIS